MLAKKVRSSLKTYVKPVKVLAMHVMTSEYVDMIKTGIVDPAKVTRSALQNASSIAAMVLTTETLITDKLKNSFLAECRGGMRGGMGGMGGMDISSGTEETPGQRNLPRGFFGSPGMWQ